MRKKEKPDSSWGCRLYLALFPGHSHLQSLGNACEIWSHPVTSGRHGAMPIESNFFCRGLDARVFARQYPSSLMMPGMGRHNYVSTSGPT